MNKKLIAIMFAFIMIGGAGLVLFQGNNTIHNTPNVKVSPETSGTAIQIYATINLTNSQSTATSKDFTQLIKMDWVPYSTYLNSNLSNVRFYDSINFTASNELSGWIGDNNTNTSISSNVWVNLSSVIIPANGYANIYMVFLPKTASSEFPAVIVAPLSCETEPPLVIVCHLDVFSVVPAKSS